MINKNTIRTTTTTTEDNNNIEYNLFSIFKTLFKRLTKHQSKSCWTLKNFIIKLLIKKTVG